MSAPPGRSATVTSLSGRVNALKFMQRATASSASSAASASNTRTESSTASQRTPPASRSPATTSPSASIRASPLLGAAEEEQWSLSPAAIAKLRPRAQAQAQSQSQSQSHQSTTQEPKRPKIYQEAGFDAWLIEREKQLSDEATNRINQRHTFGQLGKQQGGDKDEDEGEDEEQDSRKRPRGQTDDEQGQESEESEEQGSQPRFVKPGSLGKRSKSNTKHIANGSPDSLSNKANKGKRRTSNDQDKVVFTRKRGGKPGISGGGR